MTIPKSYEDLAADLASEKIISKTLFGQKESYMMLADGRKFDLDALQQRLAVAERRESEAREELLDLSRKLDVFYSRSHGIKNLSAIEDANDKSKSLQHRLTFAEQRAADNLKLISGLVEYADNLLADVNNAWFYAGSTGEPEAHKDEDYAAALNLLSATVSSHE